MSFEIYLQCFDHGEPAGISRSSIRSLFPIVDSESEPDFWRVRYDDRNSCDISVTSLPTDSSLIESVCVFRPCGDLKFWDAILELMRLGSVALLIPGDAPPLVASELTSEHLPVDMVENMGRTKIVKSAQEILDQIKHT